jgi:polyphosphate kinase
MKMNALVDPDLIDALYEASRAGVRIDLMVRGICCLRPGVEGLSPTITVRSLIGRFLEHSRVYRFANGSGEGLPLHLMGSADLMPRNLDRRVEALVPITEPELRERIDELLDLEMADEYLAWDLGPEGSWRRLNGDPATNSQALLMDRASS